MSKSRMLIAATLALTGVLGGGAAQAGNADLQWSIVIGTPVYTRPAPVHVQPLPVYRPSARVWSPPAPVHARRADLRATRWDRDGDGIPNATTGSTTRAGTGWRRHRIAMTAPAAEGRVAS